ncbi:MAG: GTPase domain-containing protein [Legionella sp.]|nr:GTPase domain-containing protein [Legionella sp.]
MKKAVAVKVVFFGPKKSGKSVLVNSFYNLEYECPEVYQKTNGIASYSKEYSNDGFVLQCWDCSGDERWKQVISPYQKGARIGVYCVDLTEPLHPGKIDTDIASFKENARDASLIIVGTKSDCLGACIESFKELQFYNSFIVSGKNKDGTEELFTKLHELGKQHAGDPNATAIDVALANVDSASLLYESLQNLKNKMALLPEDKYISVGEEAKTLVENLKKPFVNRNEVINKFETNCYRHLEGDNPVLEAVAKTVAVVAITAVVTVIAALVGFGFGLATGAWMGPGAFANGVIIGSAVAGVVAGGLITHGFYKASPIEEAVYEVVERAYKA